MAKKKETRGGKRRGAGRHKGPEKKLINFKLPVDIYNDFKMYVGEPSREFEKWAIGKIAQAKAEDEQTGYFT